MYMEHIPYLIGRATSDIHVICKLHSSFKFSALKRLYYNKKIHIGCLMVGKRIEVLRDKDVHKPVWQLSSVRANPTRDAEKRTRLVFPLGEYDHENHRLVWNRKKSLSRLPHVPMFEHDTQDLYNEVYIAHLITNFPDLIHHLTSQF